MKAIATAASGHASELIRDATNSVPFNLDQSRHPPLGTRAWSAINEPPFVSAHRQRRAERRRGSGGRLVAVNTPATLDQRPHRRVGRGGRRCQKHALGRAAAGSDPRQDDIDVFPQVASGKRAWDVPASVGVVCFYDPTTGTFLSPDPIDGHDGTTTVANAYHYVGNDPLNYVDPLGLSRVRDCDLGAAEVRGADLDGDTQDSILGEVEDHGGCILDFLHENGDCCLVMGYGNIDSAQNIAIVLEGTGQSLGGFAGGVAEKARAVGAAAGGSTAVIAWLGYDSPNSAFTGYQKGPAQEGGPALAAFVNELRERVGGRKRITTIGHSYGSVVVGEAMSSGMRANAAIITGTPGINANSVAVTGFGGLLYVGCAPGDDWVNKFPVVHGKNLCGSSGPGSFSGAQYFDVTGSEGHNEYFAARSTSLRSMAAIVTGVARKGEDGIWGAP